MVMSNGVWQGMFSLSIVLVVLAAPLLGWYFHQSPAALDVGHKAVSPFHDYDALCWFVQVREDARCWRMRVEGVQVRGAGNPTSRHQPI